MVNEHTIMFLIILTSNNIHILLNIWWFLVELMESFQWQVKNGKKIIKPAAERLPLVFKCWNPHIIFLALKIHSINVPVNHNLNSETKTKKSIRNLMSNCTTEIVWYNLMKVNWSVVRRLIWLRQKNYI